MPRNNSVGDGDSVTQKRTLGALPDAVRQTKKSSTPVASDTTAEKGAADKNKATTNRNLAQGKESDAVRTATSYFDPVWNAFSKHTDGSMQWIPKQIVAIGEDFHSQVGEGKVRTTLYKVRWAGYDTPNRRILEMLLFDMLRAQCQHVDLSSDIRTRPIWSTTISEVDMITQNSQIDWQQCNMWPTRRYVTIHTYAQRVCSVAKLNDRG